MKFFVCFLTISHYNILFAYGQEINVKIDQGLVKGHKHPSKALYMFYGIPYATVPTGRNKFMPALPPPHWETILDAKNDFIICPQNFGGAPYTEDCLVVNVFIPENIRIGVESKPVLAIIHGGGFSVGYGNMALPFNIVEKDIIVVSLNYRVGIHGFLCLNTENVPCNIGLKDQIAALKWIKRNIRAFGGNPDDVTLLGYSAGAASAEILTLTPAANNLFNKVILDSGFGIASWAVNPRPLEYARAVALANGAKDVDGITQLQEFYLNLSYPELLNLSNSDLLGGFAPSLEGLKNDSLIPILPHVTLRNGNFTKRPLLSGCTNAEGLSSYDERNAVMTIMNENFTLGLAPNLEYYSVMDTAETAKALKSFYFDVDNITESNSAKNFTDHFTDSIFCYWAVESAKQHSLHSAPVYLYHFTYVIFIMKSTMPGFGAGHCAQTNLILSDGVLSRNMALNENDLIVQRRLVNMWSSFIKLGDPEPTGDFNWKPLNPAEMNYVNIDFNIQRMNFPWPDKMQLWDRILK